MGSISYDGTTIAFPDRLLQHLQIVIVQKFKKNESFLMSWKEALAVGDGRGSAWMHPAIPLRFRYLGSRSPDIDRAWLELLGTSADSGTGLIVTDESGTPVEASENGRDQYPGHMKEENPPGP